MTTDRHTYTAANTGDVRLVFTDEHGTGLRARALDEIPGLTALTDPATGRELTLSHADVRVPALSSFEDILLESDLLDAAAAMEFDNLSDEDFTVLEGLDDQRRRALALEVLTDPDTDLTRDFSDRLWREIMDEIAPVHDRLVHLVIARAKTKAHEQGKN